MKVYEAALKRRSVRRFKDKPVPFDVLEKCVESARLAPSGRNNQVCEYIAVIEASLLPVIFENIGGSVKLPPDKGGPRVPEQTATAYIIVLINKTFEGGEGRRHISHYDVGMAAENIMLVALEEGLGSCAVLTFNEGNLKQALKIPAGYDIALVIALGYPDETPVAEVSTGTVESKVDEKGVRHVYKRKLADILHKNTF
ncbi:MAG TPA: nitroreductase family protein [Dehalococcoidales bacterium]|nr:nitroreductase family protein [Dehalococcoidales bacterium]